MFDQTFVDGGKTNQSWTVIFSLALECVLAGAMILIPLIWTGTLPKPSEWSMLTAPAPAPPPRPSAQPVRKVVKMIRRQFIGAALQAPMLQAPITIPAHVAVWDAEPQTIPGGGDGVGLIGTESGDLLNSLGTAGPGIGKAPLPPSLAPKAQPRNSEPVRQSSGVQAAKCVSCPKPAYPPIARQARIQGAVQLSAVIAKDGSVRRLTLVSSSNPLLTKAAMDAVKQWVYRPTILDKDPQEVVTEITINFALE